MPKTAYLTIDDAPSGYMNDKVDLLLSKGMPAVFFCRGKRLLERPEPAVHAIRSGFTIGNHSFGHPHFSEISLGDGFEQIRKTDEIIESAYARSGVERPAKFFRFPYGDKGAPENRERLQEFLRNMGYLQPRFDGITYRYYRDGGYLSDVDWHWTYDVAEYAVFSDKHRFGIDSIEKVLARMDEDRPDEGLGLNYNGSDEIILMHDFTRSSVFFERIINGLLAKGIAFGSAGI